LVIVFIIPYSFMISKSSKKCIVNRSNKTYPTKQGFRCHSGISFQTAETIGLCMHVVRLPPGSVEKAHLHQDHETAIYQISGTSELRYGEQLEEFEILRPGEFLYIPPNTPHLPRNSSETEECVVVIARTDPNEQESVKLLPHLEKLVPEWTGKPE
jgi:uncharacterized RmlC-like cupin family protein